jgi:hypothetical protein
MDTETIHTELAVDTIITSTFTQTEDGQVLVRLDLEKGSPLYLDFLTKVLSVFMDDGTTEVN